MSAENLPPDVAAYLEQVRAALADVPGDERDELLADVEVSLLEGAADAVEPVAVRLGPPEVFAKELRVAAGLGPAASAAPRRRRLRALLAHPRIVGARELGGELAPIWWLTRGYVAIVAASLLLGVPWSNSLVGIPEFGTPIVGLLLVGAAIAGSIALGLRERAGQLGGRGLAAANLVALVAALPVAAQVADGRASVAAVAEAYFEPHANSTVTNMGADVTNIYPYSRDGELLFDVLLYDSYGQPLQVGTPDRVVDPQRRRIETQTGEELLNAFPIRYFEPGTRRIADPDAGPSIEIPEIITPELEPKPTPAPKRKRKR